MDCLIKRGFVGLLATINYVIRPSVSRVGLALLGFQDLVYLGLAVGLGATIGIMACLIYYYCHFGGAGKYLRVRQFKWA